MYKKNEIPCKCLRKICLAHWQKRNTFHMDKKKRNSLHMPKKKRSTLHMDKQKKYLPHG